MSSFVKITVGCVALAIGVAAVWISGIYQIIFFEPAPASPVSTEAPRIFDSDRAQSGKILLSFRNFEYGKEWVANLEVFNGTNQPIFYIGSKRGDRFDYCTLAVRHEEPFPANPNGKIENLSFNVADACYHGKYFGIQVVNPGEGILLAARDHKVRDMLGVKDPTKETKAQIGFEIFTGEEKLRKILWSEEITFPPDPSRQ